MTNESIRQVAVCVRRVPPTRQRIQTGFCSSSERHLSCLWIYHNDADIQLPILDMTTKHLAKLSLLHRDNPSQAGSQREDLWDFCSQFVFVGYWA